MVAVTASMAISYYKGCYTVLKPVRTALQTVEIFHLTLSQLFSKQKQYTEKRFKGKTHLDYMTVT